MREPRNLVMTLIEASWEDPNGTLQTVSGCMEDRSVSGACIRLKARIVVGSKLRIQSHWEQFSGTAKYCRSEGKDFIVGIHREKVQIPVPAAPPDVPSPDSAGGSSLHFSTAEVESRPKRQESKPTEIPKVLWGVECVPLDSWESEAHLVVPRTIDQEPDAGDRPSIPQSENLDARPWTEPQTKQPPKAKEAGNERKPMQRKWLGLAGWRTTPENFSGSGNGNGHGNGNGNGNGKNQSWNRAPELVRKEKKTSADAAGEDAATFPVELLPVGEIYRVAGITNPRRGYSIGKIIEMLHSERLRGLSKEMRRAAVLMALDAAGISLDQVHQDARTHQEALDSYEVDQRKQLDAGCAWKAEENVQIQAELERVKAHYVARISRNVDAVEREKAMFGDWLAMKQQAAQNISEAAELCSESIVSERDRSDSDSLPDYNMEEAGTGRRQLHR